MTPKVVMFSMDIGEKPKDTNNMDTDGKENKTLTVFLLGIKIILIFVIDN